MATHTAPPHALVEHASAARVRVGRQDVACTRRVGPALERGAHVLDKREVAVSRGRQRRNNHVCVAATTLRLRRSGRAWLARCRSLPRGCLAPACGPTLGRGLLLRGVLLARGCRSRGSRSSATHACGSEHVGVDRQRNVDRRRRSIAGVVRATGRGPERCRRAGRNSVAPNHRARHAEHERHRHKGDNNPCGDAHAGFGASSVGRSGRRQKMHKNCCNTLISH